MAIPLTAEAAMAAGFLKAKPEDVAKSKASPGGLHFHHDALGYLCYAGPCANGERTVCYNNGEGCSDCYQTPEGCG